MQKKPPAPTSIPDVSTGGFNVTGKVTDERYIKLVSGYKSEQAELIKKLIYLKIDLLRTNKTK